MDKPFRASLISALVYNVAVLRWIRRKLPLSSMIYLVALVQVGHHELSFASSEFTDSLCLFPKDDDDGVSRFVITRFVNDLTSDQAGPQASESSLLEFVRGSSEE